MDLAADEIPQLLKHSGTGDREATGRLPERIHGDLRWIARTHLRVEHAGQKPRAPSGLRLEAS
ncbi:MAG TPA: hypothetical protein VGD42_00600 [Lysobacter sp.]